jgi:hypothetical protein
MPIKDDKALTKVRGVANRESQRTLKHLQKTKDDYTVEITGDMEVILHSQALSESVEVGVIREKYLDFIYDLHHPIITPKITGGLWEVYDENLIMIKQVLHMDDLPIYEQGLIYENHWTIRRNHNGLNLMIEEDE